MRNDYKIDFASQTITITAAFELAMSNPKSDAYKTIRKLCADFPNMRIVRRTHRTPTRYTSKQGDVSACNPYKNLTYEKMEQFISALPNSTSNDVMDCSNSALPPINASNSVLPAYPSAKPLSIKKADFS